MKLLYRASCDGFRAMDFHLKCDRNSKTITFIQTNSGCIFGGYTRAYWTGVERYIRDRHAFLFSLVNPSKKPLIGKIDDESCAILCKSSCGPTFGKGHNIYICDNSNTSYDSYTKLESYSRIGPCKDSKSYNFCETEFFRVKEIEVFKIV